MADARLSALSDEALTDGDPSRHLSAMSAETLTTNATVPERQLSAMSAESLTVAATVPERQLSAMSIEVLAPANLTYIGWGVPITTPSW